MALKERERLRREFVGTLERYAITKARAAELLHSSLSRVTSWCREEAARGSNPVPMWAIELLRFKIDALKLEPAKHREGT